MSIEEEQRTHSEPYGQGDATYCAAGQEAGIRKLVDCFYDIMSTQAAYHRIHSWHPDVDIARDKLARFLCAWMGGPRRYQEKYGPINIPKAHSHLPITLVERDMWLNCMFEALAQQPYSESLKKYLIEQLTVPAEHIRIACAQNV